MRNAGKSWRAAPAARAALALCGWAGGAYLGYWLALLLDQALVPLLAGLLAGSAPAGWEAGAFRLFVSYPEGFSRPSATIVVLLAQLTVIAIALVLRPRPNAPPGSAERGLPWLWVQTGSFWVVLLLGGQAVDAVDSGRSWLYAGLVYSSGSAAATVVLAALAPVLVFSGTVLARRLVRRIAADAGAGWMFGSVALCALTAAILLLRVRGMGGSLARPGAMALLAMPVLFCLASTVRLGRAREVGTAARAMPPAAAIFAIGAAAALFALSASAERIAAWTAERSLARHETARREVLYAPGDFDPQVVARFSTERAAVADRLHARLGEEYPSPPVRIVLQLHYRRGWMRPRGDSGRGYAAGPGTVRVAADPSDPRVEPAADAEAVLRALWGPPGSLQAATTASVMLAGEWRGRTLSQWMAILADGGPAYSLREVLSDESLSPLVRVPLGAVWMDSLEKHGGLAAVRKIYAAANAPEVSAAARLLGEDAAALERRWRERAAALRASAAEPVQAADGASGGLPFLRGVSFSWEGGGGYSSPEARRQLRYLRGVNANAVALVPYGFVRLPDGAQPSAGTRISYLNTGESDHELIAALRMARTLGLRVMLKPQLWVAGGRFTGELRLETPGAQAAWFREYRNFLLHYARLAAAEGFDVLCVGTELGGTTGFEGEWREMIAAARKVYRGPLTYAAHWDGEVDTIGFWDTLDYLGVNSYFPLSKESPADAETLARGAQAAAIRLEALARKFGKPVLLTEVGFSSARGAAVEPWADNWRRGVSVAEQAAAYEATFQAFAGREWLAGMFWWKWPSNGRGGPQDVSHSPVGKPAAEVLRRWYGSMAGAGK